MPKITIPAHRPLPVVASNQNPITQTGPVTMPPYQVHNLAFTFDGEVLLDPLVNGLLGPQAVLTARLREQRDFREVLLARARQKTPVAQIFRDPQVFSKEELSPPEATTMSYMVVGFMPWPTKSLPKSMRIESDSTGGSPSITIQTTEMPSFLVVAAIPPWSIQTLFLYVLLEPKDGLCTPYYVNFENCQQIFWRWPFCAKSISDLGKQKSEEVFKEILVSILAIQRQGIGDCGSRTSLGLLYGDNFQGGPDTRVAKLLMQKKEEEIKAREEDLSAREAALAAFEKKLEKNRLDQEEKLEQDRLALEDELQQERLSLEKQQSEMKDALEKLEADRQKLKKRERKIEARREELAESLVTVADALRHGGEVIVKKSDFTKNSKSIKQEDNDGVYQGLMKTQFGSKRGGDNPEGEGHRASKRLRQRSPAPPEDTAMLPPSERQNSTHPPENAAVAPSFAQVV